MGSLPSEGLDETHCLWAICPHPCCWDSEQRIARGIPRHIQSRTSDTGRGAPVEEEAEGFPTLSVVNVSEWSEGRKPMKMKLLFKTLSREDAAADAPLTVLSSQSQKQQREHSERADLHFPRNFVVHTSPHDGKQKKGVKLSTAQIKPLTCSSSESSGSGSLVMWIANPQHTPQCHSQNRSSPLVAVKELFCLPSSQLYKSDRLNRKKLKPVRKRVRFQLTPVTPQQGSEVGLGSPVAEGGGVDPADPDLAQPDPDRNRQGEEGALTLQGQVRVQASPRPPSAPRAPSAFLLRNKPMVFHSVRERILRRNTQQDPPVYKYKLDTETSVQDINWEKLRRQTYLWRKRNVPAGRDQEKPAPPQEGIPVSQEDQQWDSFDFYPVAKATLHYHPTSPLSIGPAVWQCVNCVKGVWPGQRGVLPSKSKCHHSGLSNSYLTLCNGSDVCLNPMHRLLYRDDVSDVDMSKGAIAPYNSMLYLQEAALQDSDSGGVYSGFGREGGRGPKPGASEQTGSSADDKGPPGFLPPPPPSSLNSVTCGDGRP